MSIHENKKINILIYLCSFLIPALYFCLAFYPLGIYPKGPSTLLIYDMRAQLVALYGYLSQSGPGFDGLLHNMSGGLGGGFLGTIALYISPFDFVYCFVPLKNIPDVLYILTLLKISFSGLFFSIFIIRQRKFELHPAITVMFSCCYALMTYNFMYSMSPMWLDLVMFMPLLALFLEKIVYGKFSLSFIVLMSFCVFSDYYIAYMVIIAVSMYFIFRLIEEDYNFKDCLRRIILFAFHGIIAAGISAVVLLPVICDFGRGKLSEFHNHEGAEIVNNSLTEVISSFNSMSYSTLDGGSPPNVFCGTVIFLLALIWFISGKKDSKARIVGGLIVLIYIISFVFAPIDRIWHGFRNPVGFSARYSFTFSFFMLCFALRGCSFVVYHCRDNLKSLLKLAGAICVIYTAFELYVNSSYIISRLAVEARYSTRKEYDRYLDTIDGLLAKINYDATGGYARICKNFRYSRFDGAMYGYDGLDRFSSSYNLAVDEFMCDLGLGSSYHTLTELGLTPPVAGLINMGYFMSYFKDYSDYYEYLDSIQGVELYRNNERLPLAFNVDRQIVENTTEFGEIPFENINILYSELLGSDGLESDDNETSVFTCENYIRTSMDLSLSQKNGALDLQNFQFCTKREGHYWFYTEYLTPDVDRYTEAWENGEYSEISPYADCYINGTLLGTYISDEFSFCNDIGCLDAETEYSLMLETSMSKIGDTYIYYYDSDRYYDICNKLKKKAFKVESISSSGMVLTGCSSEDSFVMVSLPYEDGYNIYVDGMKTDYIAYRNALLLIPVSEGNHEILIKYFPKGMLSGAIISIIFIISVIFIMVDLHYKKVTINGLNN